MNLAPYTIPLLKHYKNGTTKLVGVKAIKWFASPMRTIFVQRHGDYQQITYEAFNPGSRSHIIKWMEEDYGYTFPYYTHKGNIRADAASLTNMSNPAGKLLKKYLKTSKDQSQIGGADGSILKNYDEVNSVVRSRVDTNGTVTGRFTSSSINLAQIPAQKEFREIFRAPKGWSFIGTDFSGQENVNLAEMLHPYDNGRLDNIILSGSKSSGTDLHSLNAKACGISRGAAKPLWFGFLYGSSATLTGYTLLGNNSFTSYTNKEFNAMKTKLSKRVVVVGGKNLYPINKGTLVPFNDHIVVQALYGAKIQADLIASTDGLSELIKDLTTSAKANGYVTMLGGRRVPIRHAHATLNSQLQGMGAEAMKYYLVFFHEEAKRLGLRHGEDFKQQACIYDEVDLIARDDVKFAVANLLQDTYKKVSDRLGMKCTYTGEVIIGGHTEKIDEDTGETYIADNSWYGCH